MRHLEVHPELGRISEVFGKQKGGLWGDAAFAADQFVDSVDRNMQSAGKLGLRQSQRFEELGEQDLAGMGCDAKFGKHGGDSSMIISAANFFTFAVREFEYNPIIAGSREYCKSRRDRPS